MRWAGSTHDSRIFRNSRLNLRLQNNEIDGILVADAGYPCTRQLLTPLSNPITPAEEKYNKAQIKTRNSVERLFGLWKRRFPCLQKGLATKLSTTANIIIACAILHNISINVHDSVEDFEKFTVNAIEPRNFIILFYFITVLSSDTNKNKYIFYCFTYLICFLVLVA